MRRMSQRVHTGWNSSTTMHYPWKYHPTDQSLLAHRTVPFKEYKFPDAQNPYIIYICPLIEEPITNNWISCPLASTQTNRLTASQHFPWATPRLSATQQEETRSAHLSASTSSSPEHVLAVPCTYYTHASSWTKERTRLGCATARDSFHCNGRMS